MKTAKEFIKELYPELNTQLENLIIRGRVCEVLAKFAQYHVQQALFKAALNSTVEVVDYEELSQIAKESELLPVYGVDEDSILKSYPLDNIK